MDQWAENILAHPITKQPATSSDFKVERGVIDARVYLKNTYGYSDWSVGQDVFETWETDGEGYKNDVEAYKKETSYDKPIYDYFKITGDVLDIGGLTGTLREFLPKDIHFISIDPFIAAPYQIPKAKIEAYKCISERLNFVGGLAEFLPFQAESFDYVHMRSMLDHVQVPDLALMEACRVLKPKGLLLVGMSVAGGKSGKRPPIRLLKDSVLELFELVGIEKYKDFHSWHPTYKNLVKLITDNGFKVIDSYWQPYWKDQVVYVLAQKS